MVGIPRSVRNTAVRRIDFWKNPSHSDFGLLPGPFCIGFPIINDQAHLQNRENPDFEILENVKNIAKK